MFGDLSRNRFTGLDGGGARRAHAYVHGRSGCPVGGDYHIVRHLSSGGMGHVYLAEHRVSGAHAAVKLPLADSPLARTLLTREAQLLSRIAHRNVVSYLDAGKLHDGLEYLLMEYAPGVELDAWLGSCGAMPIARALRILEQVGAAVDHLHACGIVHRDIKPANVLFDPAADDRTKLVDFGIASPAARRRSRRRPTAATQVQLDTAAPAIDRHGVAALALELLTGQPVHTALPGTLTPIESLPDVRGLGVPGLQAVFERGLQYHPLRRYRSARDFVRALSRTLSASAQATERAAHDARKPIARAGRAKQAPVPQHEPKLTAAALPRSHEVAPRATAHDLPLCGS